MDDRYEERSDSTLCAQKSRPRRFVSWCDGDDDIDNMNDFTGRDRSKEKLWRREDADLSNVIPNVQLHTLRVVTAWM